MAPLSRLFALYMSIIAMENSVVIVNLASLADNTANILSSSMRSHARGQRNVVRNKMWWVQCPNHCQFHSQNQLLQYDISRLSVSNSTKIFKGAEYNLSIHAYKFCSHRSLRCRPAWGRRRTPFKLGLVQRSTTSGRRSWETSKLSYRRPILGVQTIFLAFKNISF